MHASHDSPWTCGYCAKTNSEVSFVLACPECEKEASGFICCHCEKVNAEDAKGEVHPARFESQRKPKPTPDDEERSAVQAHLAEKARIEREIELKKLKLRLAQVESSPIFQKELSALEREEQKYADHEQAVVGLLRLEDRKRAEYEAQFGDRPDDLEKHNLALDQHMLNNGQEPRRKRSSQ